METLPEEATMKVMDVMHSSVTWVAPSTPVSDVARKMRDEDIGAIPIGENDRLVGMVTDRDIVCRVLADGLDVSRVTAGDIMSHGILYCRADEDVEDAIRIMEKNQVRRLPVINEKKRMVGMLSLGDISHKVPRSLSGEVVEAVAAHHA
jgi:CBS domain-containing protein